MKGVIDDVLFFVYFTLRAIRIESDAIVAEIKVTRGAVLCTSTQAMRIESKAILAEIIVLCLLCFACNV